MHRIFKNNKSGEVYILINLALNATNGATEGQSMAVYHPQDNPGILYVREAKEFLDKFTEVKNG